MRTLIAHRGSHAHMPENTLAAFDAAARDGAEMVEFDVRRTADGQLAVFHDPAVARTPLSRLTLEELRTLSGVAVPVLADVLAWAERSGVGLDVELKEDGYVAEVAAMLAPVEVELLVTSFLDPVVAQLAELAPGIRRGLLFELTTLGAVKRLRACRADAAVLKAGLLGDGRVLDDLVLADRAVMLWDFLPGRHAQWLEDERVGAIITDDVTGTRRAERAPALLAA